MTIGETIPITASFGVARQMSGKDAASVRRAYKVYAAKQGGRNRVERGVGDQLCPG